MVDKGRIAHSGKFVKKMLTLKRAPVVFSHRMDPTRCYIRVCIIPVTIGIVFSARIESFVVIVHYDDYRVRVDLSFGMSGSKPTYRAMIMLLSPLPYACFMKDMFTRQLNHGLNSSSRSVAFINYI